MALRKIFGPKRNEVTGDYRKLYIEGLHNLHCILRGSIICTVY